MRAGSFCMVEKRSLVVKSTSQPEAITTISRTSSKWYFFGPYFFGPYFFWPLFFWPLFFGPYFFGPYFLAPIFWPLFLAPAFPFSGFLLRIAGRGASSQIRQAKHTLTQKRLRRKNTIAAQPPILLYSFCMQVSISRAERVCSQSPILPRFCVRTASAYCREPDRDICAGQIHPVSRQILDG